MLHLRKKSNMLRLCSFILATFCAHTNAAAPKRYQMGIIDTGFHNKLIYKTFVEIAQHAGFDVSITTLDELIDMDITSFDCSRYDLLLFALEEECIAQLKTSPIAHRVISLVQRHATIPQTITGLMFPPSGRFAYKDIQGHPFYAYQPLVTPCGFSFDISGHLGYTPKNISSVSPLPLLSCKVALEQTLYNPFGPLASYRTTLKQPQAGSGNTPQPAVTSPLGVVVKNPATNHLLLLGSSGIFSVSSITENFHLCPVDDAMRERMHTFIFHGLQRCAALLDTAHNPGSTRPLTALPKLLSQSPDAQSWTARIQKYFTPKKRNRSHELRRTAWMDLEPFQSADKKTEQQRLITYILQGDFDALWLSISPNQYFSPKAKFKDRMPQLETSIEQFSSQLVHAAQKAEKPIPKIIVSFEIANNFVEAYKNPQPCAQDLYGNSFSDVPAPLDRIWWQEEIIDSAKAFAKLWKKHATRLPLNGFVFDLEMYLRNESRVGEFVSTTIGSPADLTEFLQNESPFISDFASALIAQKKGMLYRTYLTNQAAELSSWLKSSLQKIVPHAIVACYAANVSLDPLYLGFYTGLSSEKNPLTLFSFNSRWDIHKNDAAALGLYVNHSAVALLSHMQSRKDFSYFSMLMQRNDGIWLNKLCRMSHAYQPNEWHRAEQTSLSFDDRSALMTFVAEQ